LNFLLDILRKYLKGSPEPDMKSIRFQVWFAWNPESYTPKSLITKWWAGRLLKVQCKVATIRIVLY